MSSSSTQYETDEHIINVEKAEAAYGNSGNALSDSFLAQAKSATAFFADKDDFFKFLICTIILNDGDNNSVQFAEETRVQLFIKAKAIFDALSQLQQQKLPLLAHFQASGAAATPQLKKLGSQLKGIVLCMDMIEKPIAHAIADAGRFDLLQQLYKYLPTVPASAVRDGSMQWMTLVAKAAAQGNLDFVQFMLCLPEVANGGIAERQKLILQRDQLKLLPHHYACLTGELEMLQFLLEKILQLDFADVPSMIACACQAASHEKHLQIVEYLLNLFNTRAIKVPSLEQSKEKEALFANRIASELVCAPIDEQICDMLKQISALPLRKKFVSSSANAGTISRSSSVVMKIVQLLDKHKFVFTATALHGACQSKNLQLVTFIAKTYPKLVNEEDPESNLRAVHHALQDLSILKCLAEDFKATVEFAGQDGAYMLCNSLQNEQVFKYLVAKGAPFQAKVSAETGSHVLHLACEQGSLAAVKTILEHEDSVKQNHVAIKDAEGNNVLHYAARSDNFELITYLLSQSGAKQLKQEHNSQGSSPFHIALLNNISTQIIQSLMEPELVNQVINDEFLSNTYPLHQAVNMRDADLVKALLQAGAKANQKGGEQSLTPLQQIFSDRIPELESVAMVLLQHPGIQFDKKEALAAANECEWNQVKQFLK